MLDGDCCPVPDGDQNVLDLLEMEGVRASKCADEAADGERPADPMLKTERCLEITGYASL